MLHCGSRVVGGIALGKGKVGIRGEERAGEGAVLCCFFFPAVLAFGVGRTEGRVTRGVDRAG